MLPPPLKRLIDAFRRIPGIGPKTAERIGFFLLKQGRVLAPELATALNEVHQGVSWCSTCCNVSDKSPCSICDDPARDRSSLLIVEDPKDVFALENTGVYRGLYHVLHGAIAPVDGITEEKLTMRELEKRMSTGTFREIILGTNPTVSGEATAIHLTRLLKPRGLRITHLAQGLPMGGNLEFADPDTLKKAILGRREE